MPGALACVVGCKGLRQGAGPGQAADSAAQLAALRGVLRDQEALTRTALAALAHAHSQAASAQQARGATVPPSCLF